MGFSLKKKNRPSAVETGAEKEEGWDCDDGRRTEASTPSPKAKGKGSIFSRRAPVEEDYGVEVGYDSNHEADESSRRSSPRKSKKGSKKAGKEDESKKGGEEDKPATGCCRRLCSRVRCFFCTALCLAVCASIGVVVWRYGPWARDENMVDAQSLALDGDGCEGCCNGLASNCALGVDEVLFPMVHNAHSSYANNFVGASNSRPLEEALVAGYRALRLSSCACEALLSKALLEKNEEWGLGGSRVGFCGAACGAGVRDVRDVLTNLKTFVEANPREVLIIQLDMKEGSSADLRTALQRSGLLEHAYVLPRGSGSWPSLQEMIDDGSRVLLFGSGDGMESCWGDGCPDGILYAGDHLSETAADDLGSCAPPDDDAPFLLVNHYDDGALRMPSAARARELNSYASLEERLASCGGRGPSLLAVEFWDEGEVLEFAMNVNKGRNREGGEYLSALPEDEERAEDGSRRLRG